MPAATRPALTNWSGRASESSSAPWRPSPLALPTTTVGVGLGVAAAGGANSPGTTVALPEVADGAMVPRCAAAPRGSVPNVNRPVFGFSQPGFHELVAASASATPNSSAVWYRSSGRRASAFITTAASGAGNAGATWLIGIGSSYAWRCSVSTGPPSAEYGSWPVRSS